MGRQPNVIVFFTDQQRWDTTGVHGNPMGLTPNFDRMAAAGTHFQYACSCQPVCAPARSVLQTGRYATNTGVYRNGIALEAGERTLAHWFRDAGYRTGYIGKWHLASSDPVPREEQGGYEEWLAANLLEFTSTPYDCRLYEGGGREVKLPGYRSSALTDAAIRFVDRHRAEPFFLTVSFLEPHHQNSVDDYPPPAGYRERFGDCWVPPDLQALGGSTARHLPGYYGMVKRLDEDLGRLFDALRSLELLEDTIVIYYADHGSHFKTRNSEYKRSGHESSIRIPCAAVGPGFTSGGRRPELFSLVDVAPTLLDAAGIPVPPRMEGRSIMPRLRGEGGEWPDDLFVQISEAEVGRAVRTHRWKYGVVAPELSGSEQAGADRYVESYLFDLEHDPYELENLVALDSHEDVCARMRARLLAYIERVEGRRPEIASLPKAGGGQRRVLPREVEQ